MIYLVLALALFVVYFICSWIVVFFFKPKVPRQFFLLFLLTFGAVYLYWSLAVFGVSSEVELAAFFAGLVGYILVCFTMWNSFYSILWGFSGGLLADFCSDESLLHVNKIMTHYQGPSDDNLLQMDRMLLRRVPPLITKGYISQKEGVFFIQGKGKIIAMISLFLYWFFVLGKGGGIVDESSEK